MQRDLQRPRIEAILIAFALWEAASRAGLANRQILPPPSEVFASLGSMAWKGELVGPILETLALLSISYSLACVSGIVVGMAMGINRRLFNLLEPLVEILRPTPKPALIPPLFLFFGIGWKSMVIIVSIAAFFPVLTNTLTGVRGIDPVLLNTVRTFRTGRWKTFLSVVLPASMPFILTGMRVSVGIAMVLVVIAEVMAGDTGVGYMILDAERSFQAPRMYAWVIVLAVIGISLVGVLTWLERVLVPWRGKN